MLDPERLSFEFSFTRALAPKEKGPRLDEFIAQQLPKLSLTLIRRLIAEGNLLVNGAASLKGVRLQINDQVTVKLFAAEKSAATPEPIPLDNIKSFEYEADWVEFQIPSKTAKQHDRHTEPSPLGAVGPIQHHRVRRELRQDVRLDVLLPVWTV